MNMGFVGSHFLQMEICEKWLFFYVFVFQKVNDFRYTLYDMQSSCEIIVYPSFLCYIRRMHFYYVVNSSWESENA